MGRRRAATTQAAVAQALRAVRAAGVIARVDVRPDGTISIVPLDAPATASETPRETKQEEIVL